MKKIIFARFTKHSLLWLGGERIRGRRHKGGNALHRPQPPLLSVFGVLRKRMAGYEVLPKKVSGYYGRELFSVTYHPYGHSDTLAAGSMTAHCQPTSVAENCQGISLVEVLIALTLLSISSLLMLRSIGSLQLSEQTQWQRREVWQQLAQRLEGSEQPVSTLQEQHITATNGCYWQRVTWQVANSSPQYLQRLRCP